ncbi:MAG: DUF6948 domain-containing protein [Planctomycetota bacterium]|jgi:hypothetical protein
MKTIIVDGVEFSETRKLGGIVLVRTYSAGVHFGTLLERTGKEIKLGNARRLWSWRGACSLSQVAMDGVDLTGSKISVKVPEITLTEAIEIIPMSKDAGSKMMGAKAWQS